MNRLFAVFLAATLLLPPAPAHALRQQEAAQTGLEEQLHDALQSPDDLVRAAGRLASTVLGLTPSAVHPELVEGERPGRRAGLEERSRPKPLSGVLSGREAFERLKEALLNDRISTVAYKDLSVRPMRFQMDMEDIERGLLDEGYDLLTRILMVATDFDLERQVRLELVGKIVRVFSAAGLEEGVAYEGDDWGALVGAIRQEDAAHPVVSLTVYETAADGWRFPVRFWRPNFHETPTNLIAAHWNNSTGRFQFRLSFQDQPVEPEAPVAPAVQIAGKPVVHARLDVQHAAGVEEGVRVIARDELDPLGVRDADGKLLSSKLGENIAGVALLPKAQVDLRDFTDNVNPQVEIYAHPSVVTWIPYWLPSGWGLFRETQLLEDNPTQANFKLAQAARSVAERRTVIIGVEKSKREGLELPRGVVLLLDPDTEDAIDFRKMAVFLSQARDLTHVILDLTSGSIRTVTIQGREYYALDIAA